MHIHASSLCISEIIQTNNEWLQITKPIINFLNKENKTGLSLADQLLAARATLVFVSALSICQALLCCFLCDALLRNHAAHNCATGCSEVTETDFLIGYCMAVIN